MILKRLSPCPSYGCELVDMLQPENVTRAQVPPVLVPGQEFHSGAKYRDSIV